MHERPSHARTRSWEGVRGLDDVKSAATIGRTATTRVRTVEPTRATRMGCPSMMIVVVVAAPVLPRQGGVAAGRVAKRMPCRKMWRVSCVWRARV
jgi:hypothetical protein